MDEVPASLSETKALAVALEAFSAEDFMDGYLTGQESAKWIARRLIECIQTIEGQVRFAVDILSNPANRDG
jgi:hypothetical protein